MTEELVRIENLKTYYFAGDEVVKAVDGVTLTLGKGEITALVGESGSGKSTLAFSIIRLLPQGGRIVDGHIYFDGVDLAALPEEEMRRYRGKRISAVFQDPLTSLDPLMRIGDQFVETLQTHFPITREEAEEKAKKLLETVGIHPERFHDYPHQLSGGMRQRVMIALAIATEPDLVIADEPTTALDVVIQAQIMDIFKRLRDRLGISFLLVTHDIALAMEVADKIAVMYAGKLVEYASTQDIYREPLHPYTQALLRAIPDVEDSSKRLVYIPGSPPDLSNPPPGCRFHPRCSLALERCSREEPPRIEARPGHMVACWLRGGE